MTSLRRVLSPLLPPIAVLLAAGLAGPSLASGQAPAYLPVSGFLTDASGIPIDGDVGIRFRLYSAATGGSVLWEETQPAVHVEQGQLSAYLGDAEALALSIFEEHTLVWVGIKVGDDQEATPRLQLATAPYAAYANSCGDAETVGGQGPDDFMASDAQIPWSSISDPPAIPTWSTLSGKPGTFPPSNHALDSHPGNLPASRISGSIMDQLDIQLVSETVEVTASSEGFFTKCPSGYTVLSGGCLSWTTYTIQTSMPLNFGDISGDLPPDAWWCVFKRSDSNTSAVEVGARVYCAK